MLGWSAQKQSISSEICLENNHKVGRFLLIAFWWSFALKTPAKSANFSANLSLKILQNYKSLKQTWGLLAGMCVVEDHEDSDIFLFWLDSDFFKDIIHGQT